MNDGVCLVFSFSAFFVYFLFFFYYCRDSWLNGVFVCEIVDFAVQVVLESAIKSVNAIHVRANDMDAVANIAHYHNLMYQRYKDSSGCVNPADEAVKELSGNLYKYTHSVEDKTVEVLQKSSSRAGSRPTESMSTTL